MQSCSKAICTVAFVSLATVVCAQSQPKYNSLLWRITGPDLPQPSYLYGTMHVSGKVAFHLSEGFFEALEQSSVVALEMDPEKWLGEMADDSWYSALDQAEGRDHRSRDLYRDGFALEFPDRAAFTKALAQDPEVIDDLLYRMNEGNANHEEDTYLDLFIYQCAARMGKRVAGLERMDHSIQQLLLSLAPDDDEKEDPILERKRKEFRATAGDPVQALEDSYRAQDLDRMDTLHDLTRNSKRSRRYVIDERNRHFLNNMLPYMRQGGLFCGVGAMHLPGDSGLVEMLRREGYTVAPVRSQVSNRSRSAQRKMETLYRPVTWHTCAPADNAFTIELPAPLHRIGSQEDQLLISADVVNGSHFLVQRIPTYASLRGLTPDDILLRIDSALYEGVPGRILSTGRSVTNTGWPCVDVESVDRLGRAVHFKVVVAPFEVFVFERTMRDLPQAAKDGQRAFASLRFNRPGEAQKNRWQPAYGGCSMDLPGERSIVQPLASMGWSSTAAVEKVCEAQAIDRSGNASFLYIGTYYPDATTVEQDTFELNVLAEAFSEQFGLTGTANSIAPMGDQLRGFGVLPMGDTIRYNIRIQGARYDLLCARGSSEAVQRFFDSYRQEPLASPAALHQYRDTLMHFRVRTDCTHEVLMGHLKPFSNYFGKVWRTNKLSGKNSHTYQEHELIYRSTTAPDAVRVALEKFHRFGYIKDEDKFWERRIEKLAQDGKLTVKHKELTGDFEHRTMHLLLTCPASSRTVKVMMRQTPGALYTLTATADSSGKTTDWADAFFGSFEPDTAFSEGTFRKKGDVLLEWLTSGDSTKMEQARSSFLQAWFPPEAAPGLMAYINSPDSRNKDHGKRNQAIKELGRVQHADVLPFLLKLHSAAGDTTDLRFDVLEAIGWQQTTASAAAFLDLVREEPPLTDDRSKATPLFRPYFDSLEVARTLFPGLWDLLAYPELESPVLRLAAALVDKGLLSATDLAPRKAELLSKGKAELKRAVASAKSTKGRQGYRSSEGPPTVKRNVLSAPDEIPVDKKDMLEEFLPGEAKDGLAPFLVYERLLLPFRKDPEVQAFFNRALGSGKDETVLPTAAFLLHRKATVPDSIWKKASERHEARLWTYRTLQAMERTDLFGTPGPEGEQDALAYYLAGWRDHEKDSVKIVGARTVATRFGTGTVHFITSRIEREDKTVQWRLGCTGFFGGNDQVRFANKFIRRAKDNVLREEDLNAAIDDLAEELRYIGRSRWKSKARSSFLGGMDLDY